MKTGKLNVLRVLVIFMAATFLAGCDEAELQSQWPSKPISIDGADVEWPEDGQYFDEESKLLVTIMNDENNIYIRWLTRNPTTKMLVLQVGFTVWIDETGGTSKTFGVQFPLAQPKQRGTINPDFKPRTEMEDILADSQYNLAILLNGLEGNRQTMPTTKAEELGIYPKLGLEKGYLVYELKMPLSAARDGRQIVGIGFETGSLERPSGQGSRGGGRGKGGGRGGKGSGGGNKKMGGNRGNHGGGSPEPIEMWAKVHLAGKPTE